MQHLTMCRVIPTHMLSSLQARMFSAFDSFVLMKASAIAETERLYRAFVSFLRTVDVSSNGGQIKLLRNGTLVCRL